VENVTVWEVVVPPDEDILELRLELEGEDDEATAADAARLRRRLLELDVIDVKRAPAEAGPGTRAGPAAELGALLVTLAPPVITTVMSEVRAWLSRRRDSTLTLTLKERSITIKGGLTDEERARLIDEFVRSRES
jgi:hypothetical protein